MRNFNIKLNPAKHFRLRIKKSTLYPLIILMLLFGYLLTNNGQHSILIPVSGKSTITVVLDNNYPPFTFLDQNGNLQGILIDRWKLWEKKTGITVEITGMDWSSALKNMQAGKYDVIDTIFKTETREQFYDFSEPYQEIEVPIYFNNKISGIVDVNSLRGFSVAVKSNDAAIDFLLSHHINNLVEYDSYEAIVQAAADQEVVVFVVDKPPADYFLYRYGIQQSFNSTESLYNGQFHRAVLKGNTELLKTIEDGFAQISKTEYAAIDRKWYGSAFNSHEFLVVVRIVGAVLLIVFLVLIGWNHSLQTQVKRKTKVVLESEQKFRQIFETSAVGIALSNIKGDFISENPAILSILGYSDEEFRQLSVRKLSHPDDLELIEQYQQELWNESKKSLTVEKRCLHKEGHYIWGRVTTSLVKDSEGKPLFLLDMLEDITDHIYSEKVRDSIYKITQATISSSSLDELYASIHQTLGKIMPVENFFIALFEAESNLLHFPFFRDQYETSAEPIEPGRSLSSYVMQMRKPLLISEKVFEKMHNDGKVALIGAPPVDWLGVPLIVNDRVIGVMTTQSYSQDIHFNLKDAEFLEIVSAQIAQAIELKRVEEARRLSELRYRHLFEDSPISIWEEDFSAVKEHLDHLKETGITNFRKYFNEHPEEISHCISLIKLLDVNNEALKLVRAKSKAELVKRLNTIFDVDQAEDFLQEILNISEGKTNFEWEGMNRTLEGDPIFVSMRWAAAEGCENTLSKVIVSLSDISARKKAEAKLHSSEEQYRNLVDNLGEGIVIFDQHTKFLFSNPSANEIFGFMAGSLEQSKLIDFICKDSQEFINQQLINLKAGESSSFDLEIIRKDKAHRYIQLSTRPQFDNEANFIGILGIIRDITGRKQAEEKRIVRSRFEELLTNISTRFINVESEDIDNEINSVLKHIGQFEKTDRAYVFRIDPKKKTMTNTHEWCQEGIASKKDEFQNLHFNEMPWFLEQITCDPLIISRIDDMPDSSSREKTAFKKHGVKSFACFPMWVNLELIGFVGFESVKSECLWDLENTAMLQQFANIISNAIERSRLLKILEDRAIRDELTGVYNRRGFLQIANTELIRALRYNHPIGMILLDMDHLKIINDTYGHSVGDSALQDIAQCCLQNIREIDILGRWGGDEFVILLPESDQDTTIHVATRLQQTICNRVIDLDGKKIKYSISAGVAMASKNGFTFDELFRNADAALYLAKEAGRNRIKTFRAIE